MRMRRKALPENARTFRRCTESTFFAERYTIPESANCPLCGLSEGDQHVMTSCARTRHLRDEAEGKIINLAKKRNKNLILPQHPIWWNHDHGQTANSEGFQFIWGSMGIIPAPLADWLKTNLGIKLKADLDAILWEYQVIILRCSQACWNMRKKHNVTHDPRPSNNPASPSA